MENQANQPRDDMFSAAESLPVPHSIHQSTVSLITSALFTAGREYPTILPGQDSSIDAFSTPWRQEKKGAERGKKSKKGSKRQKSGQIQAAGVGER